MTPQGPSDPTGWTPGRDNWDDAQSWATGPYFMPGPAQRWPVPVASTQYGNAGPNPLIANRYWAIEGEIQGERNLVAEANAEGIDYLPPEGTAPPTMSGPFGFIGDIVGGITGIVTGRQQVKTAEIQAKAAENQLRASLAQAGATVEQSKALVAVEQEKTSRFTKIALLGGAVVLGAIALKAGLKKTG